METERALCRAPSRIALMSPRRLRVVAFLGAAAATPWVRAGAAVVGALLRIRSPDPTRLHWLQPLWEAIGRYAGWCA